MGLMTRKSTIQRRMTAQPPVRTYTQSVNDASCGRQQPEAAGPILSDSSSARRSVRIWSLLRRPALWLKTLQEADLELVRILSRTAHSSLGRLCAIGISKLGNGWVYIPLALTILACWGLSGYKLILFACINAGVTHSLYPFLKRRYRRRRPFHIDPELSSLLATLDEHSFPSGHTMTMTAVLTPIVMLWPSFAIPAALMLLCLAWSRVATAHHYPSDVIAGGLLGLGLGYPIALGLISIW
jgi:undecaprenyl-diphosphatase